MNRFIALAFVAAAIFTTALLPLPAAEKQQPEPPPSAGPRAVPGTEQDVTAVFTVRIINRGKSAIRNPEIRMRLPLSDAHQDIKALEIEGNPRHQRDRWDTEGVVYQQPELAPGRVMSGRWTADCRRRELKWNLKSLPSPIPGEGQGVRAEAERSSTQAPLTLTLSQRERGRFSLPLSEEARALYLRDADRYGINTPEVQAALDKATAGRVGEMAKLEGIFDYLMNHVKYVIDDCWDPAPKVLASGQGSCSEFTYSFIALCRAAGIPARYVGGIAGRPDMPYHVDLIFHRFPQAFVEGVGWVDFDPTRNRRSKNRRLYFGRTPRQMLLLCAGDGGDDSLTGWDYRASTDWKGKKVEPFANEIDNDAKTNVIQTAWWFPTPPAEVRQQVEAFRKLWEKTPPNGRQPLVAEALKINHPLVLPWLDDLLYDPAMRAEAATTMLKIGGKEAIRAIADSLGRLNDRPGDRAIGQSLDQFTGEKNGPSRKKWEKWLKKQTPPSPIPEPLPRSEGNMQ